MKDSKPWIVKFWKTKYEREEGISEIYGCYSSFEEAYNEGIRSARLNDWACCEIQLKSEDENRAIYIYAVTEPKADGFVV